MAYVTEMQAALLEVTKYVQEKVYVFWIQRENKQHVSAGVVTMEIHANFVITTRMITETLTTNAYAKWITKSLVIINVIRGYVMWEDWNVQDVEFVEFQTIYYRVNVMLDMRVHYAIHVTQDIGSVRMV